MSTGLNQFLASFDGLAQIDQEKVAVEIWRRLKDQEYGPIDEAMMLEIADQRFHRLDIEEEQHGKSQAW